MRTLTTRTGIEIELPELKRVPASAPRSWLSKGWADLRAAPVTSIAVGLLFTLGGYALTWAAWNSPWLLYSLIPGFVLVGPFLALAFYAMSRQREQGHPVSVRDAVLSWRGNVRSLAMFALVLILVMIAWLRFSSLLAAMSAYAANSAEFSLGQLSEGGGIWFLLLYLLAGGVLAALVFMGSVVSLPMMLDRKADPITAVVSSVKVTLANRRVMLLWAATIVALVAIGMATLYIGLALVMPLVGHASWHAYRDLLGD